MISLPPTANDNFRFVVRFGTLQPSELRTRVATRIATFLHSPRGVPDGRGRQTVLTTTQINALISGIANAVGYATHYAACGETLPNRRRLRGRPPDNVPMILIDDIMEACKAAGLNPGLRYASPPSLPVEIYVQIAPILWPGSVQNPRRVFERWKNHQKSIVRTQVHP